MTKQREEVQQSKSGPGGSLEIDTLCEEGTNIGIGLCAHHSLHYIHLYNDVNRPGWTAVRCPGVFEVQCADNVNPKSIGMFMQSNNGDIVISAPNGRIRLQALDIDLRADGPNNKRGTINLDSNQSVNIKTGTFDVKAEVGYRIFSPNLGRIVANTKLYVVSNFIDGLTCASSILPGKTDPLSSVNFLTNSTYT